MVSARTYYKFHDVCVFTKGLFIVNGFWLFACRTCSNLLQVSLPSFDLNADDIFIIPKLPNSLCPKPPTIVFCHPKNPSTFFSLSSLFLNSQPPLLITPTRQPNSCKQRPTRPRRTPRPSCAPSARPNSGRSKSPRPAARSGRQTPAGPTRWRSWCRPGSGRTRSAGCRECALPGRWLGRLVCCFWEQGVLV